MISIGCFESVARCICRLVAGFKKCYPEITLHLYDGEQHELMHGLHRVASTALDSAGLRSGARPFDQRTAQCPINPIRAALPAAHPLAQKGAGDAAGAELSRNYDPRCGPQ